MADSQVKPDFRIGFDTISQFISFAIKSVTAASVLAAVAIPAAYGQLTQPSQDLNIKFGTISQTPTVLGQNKQGQVSLVVTNRGTAAYLGPINLNIYASPDGVLDQNPLETPKTLTDIGGASSLVFTSNDPLQGINELLGTVRLQNVNLTPGQSQTVTVDFTSSDFRNPSVVAPGAYYLIAQVDPKTTAKGATNNTTSNCDRFKPSAKKIPSTSQAQFAIRTGSPC